jgi:hypothetical protein
MESCNGEQYLQLPESGTRPRRFLACPDQGGEPWQKQASRKFQQNGGRRGEVVEYPSRCRQCWETTPGGCGQP